MKRTLVTGGAGFIGGHVVERLLRQRVPVRVLDNLSTGSRSFVSSLSGDLEFVEGDVRDGAAVADCMRDIGRVIHLAAEISVPQSIVDPITTYEVNVMGTLTVLEAARRASVDSVSQASSAAVYGETDGSPTPETAETNPLSPYGSSKLECEHLGSLYSEVFHLPVASLRLFNVYGPRQRADSAYAAVVPAFVEQMRAGQRPVIFGDGRQRRDFVYVGDVADALIKAASSPELGGEVMNIASGQTVDLLELVASLNGVLATAAEPRFETARPGDIRLSAADITLARSRLGFTPRVGLAEGLKAMVAEPSGARLAS